MIHEVGPFIIFADRMRLMLDENDIKDEDRERVVLKCCDCAGKRYIRWNGIWLNVCEETFQVMVEETL